jgi:TonB family protein
MTKDEKFPFYLRRSFYIHCLLASLCLVGGKMILTHEQDLRNKNLELIQASVRVDMVAMPKYTLEELKAMTPEPPATPEPAPEPKKEVAKVPEETKTDNKEDFKEKVAKELAEADKHQSFLTKLKKLSDKKISQKKAEKSSGEAQDLKRLVLAGNKLSKGTQVFGDSRGTDLSAFEAYKSQLPAMIKPHWRLPSFLHEKKLKCRVRVWIGMNGEIVRSEIYQTSGDHEYDQKALEAVNAASPFPEQSTEFGNRGLNGEILLGFPL